jgi:putative ABC transport system permease protein
VTVVATLAIGIGANTAIFSTLRAMLLEPLPYHEAGQLSFIWLDKREMGYPRMPLSGPDFRDVRRATRSFAAIAGIWASGTVALTGEAEPEQLRSAWVTTNFFEVLGAVPAIGRTFRPEDNAPGAPPTILLGWDLFERRFGGDRSIVGRQILVNDEPTLVIGVMPKTFRLLLPADASVPDRLQAWQPFWLDFDGGFRESQFLRVIARLRPGITIDQARAEIDAITDRLRTQDGISRAFTTVALQEDGVREIRGPLLALFVGVGLLLMIACVNVASLLVARAASRARETALRLALGASRGRLVRQWLVEGLLLTAFGAAAGVLAGHLGLRVLIAAAPEPLSRLGSARIDGTVVVFAVLTSLMWGVLFSLAPAIELLKVRAMGSLQPHWRSMAAPIRQRMRTVLVTVQVALSLVLLIGAGLLVRAFVEIQRVDPGFRADRRLTFRVAVPASRYANSETAVALSDDLLRRFAAMPGVTSVGAISHLPYDELPNWALAYAREPVSTNAVQARADTRAISTGLLETMDVQLVEGRLFNNAERTPVVVIDDQLARRLWPDQSALGQPLLIGQAAADRPATVVGVIRHLRQRSLVADLTPQIFLPYRLWQRNPMAYVIETTGDLSALVAHVRSAVTAVDSKLPIYDVRPMQAYVDAALAVRRFVMLLAAVFASTALILTSIGVYGLLAYAVATRRQEFGVRRALGADTRQVISQIVREGLGFAVVGCTAGLVMAALLARLLEAQLYGVRPGDPLTYGVSLALILGAATIASWIPGRRAIAVRPIEALRND